MTDRRAGTAERTGPSARRRCSAATAPTARCASLIGASMRDLGPADRWLVLDVRSAAPLPVWPGVHQVCDSRRPATFMHVTGDRYRWESPAGAGGDRRGRHWRRPAWRALLAPVDPAAVEIVRAVEYVVPGAGRRPLAGPARAAGRRRRPPEPAVRRTGARARAARRAPAGLEARRRPGGRGGRRPARQLPGRAGAARPGADRGGAAARPADDPAVAARATSPGAVCSPSSAGSRPWPRLATDSRTPPLAAGPQVERRGRAGRRLAGTLCRSRRSSWTDGRAASTTCWTARWTVPPVRSSPSCGPGELTLSAAGGPVLRVEDGDGVLTSWLGGASATAVRIRPDRIVGAVVRRA